MRHFLHVVLQTHRYATIDGKMLFEHSRGAAWRPLIDIYEQPDSIMIAVDLPGIDKESIQVVVEGDELTVSGVRPPRIPKDTFRVQHMEIQYGPFARRVALPPHSDADRIEADYDEGRLWLKVPRKVEP